MAATREVVLKVVLLGDCGVGKTSLLNRFVDDQYSNRYKATVGADLKTLDLDIQGQNVKLQIWDTAGQERFLSLGPAFFRGADICMLVFDLTKPETFEHLETWRDEFLQATKPENEEGFPIAVLANKCDLQASRAVPQNRALAWCEYKGHMSYCETSAKESTNVNRAFLDIATRALNNRKSLQKEAYKLEHSLLREPSKEKCPC